MILFWLSSRLKFILSWWLKENKNRFAGQKLYDTRIIVKALQRNLRDLRQYE